MGFLDKARETAQQALAQAQHGVEQGQEKIEEMQAKRTLDGLYRDLGAAFYAEQRHGGSRDAVVAALGAVDHHVATHQAPGGSAASGDGTAPNGSGGQG